MATNNAINLNQQGLAYYNGTGTFSAPTATQHSLILGSTNNNVVSLGTATDGQLPIGSTGADPVLATLTASTGISIVNAPGSITISSTVTTLSWVDVTGTTQAMAVNTGYLADNAGLVTLTLPATAVQFSIIRVVGHGAGGWIIAQNAGQQILFGSATGTTVGTGGSLASSNANDAVELLASVGGASTIWTVMSSVGNLTII